jgi:hypothetical protein
MLALFLFCVAICPTKFLVSTADYFNSKLQSVLPVMHHRLQALKQQQIRAI